MYLLGQNVALTSVVEMNPACFGIVNEILNMLANIAIISLTGENHDNQES